MRMLLLPFAWIYGLIIRIRNWAFDGGIFKQTSFDLPIISIGNLSMGGTGKSPMALYLAGFLASDYKVAILSRGYGRSTKGFRWVTGQSTAREVGDEPLQYVLSGLPLQVAVCENRVAGVEQLLKAESPPDVIILDDAFQHRWIKAGLSILLSDAKNPYFNDFMVPSGHLREPRSGSRRAHSIVFTKCDPALSSANQMEFSRKAGVLENQSLHFSYIHYREEMHAGNGSTLSLKSLNQYVVFLFCGIAHPTPLQEFVGNRTSVLKTKFFKDHHDFSVADAIQIKKEYLKFVKESNLPGVLITTRKDQMRLLNKEIQYHLSELPIYTLEIEVKFLEGLGESLKQQVLDFVKKG